jgi:hypothetical protein
VPLRFIFTLMHLLAEKPLLVAKRLVGRLLMVGMLPLVARRRVGKLLVVGTHLWVGKHLGGNLLIVGEYLLVAKHLVGNPLIVGAYLLVAQHLVRNLLIVGAHLLVAQHLVGNLLIVETHLSVAKRLVEEVLMMGMYLIVAKHLAGRLLIAGKPLIVDQHLLLEQRKIQIVLESQMLFGLGQPDDRPPRSFVLVPQESREGARLIFIFTTMGMMARLVPHGSLFKNPQALDPMPGMGTCLLVAPVLLPVPALPLVLALPPVSLLLAPLKVYPLVLPMSSPPFLVPLLLTNPLLSLAKKKVQSLLARALLLPQMLKIFEGLRLLEHIYRPSDPLRQLDQSSYHPQALASKHRIPS